MNKCIVFWKVRGWCSPPRHAHTWALPNSVAGRRTLPAATGPTVVDAKVTGIFYETLIFFQLWKNSTNFSHKKYNLKNTQ